MSDCNNHNVLNLLRTRTKIMLAILKKFIYTTANRLKTISFCLLFKIKRAKHVGECMCNV